VGRFEYLMMSAQVAHEYVVAGFTAVVQDNIFGSDVATGLDAVGVRPRRLVVLRASLEVVAARDRERIRATGKIAYRSGGVLARGSRSAARRDAQSRLVAGYDHTDAPGTPCKTSWPGRTKPLFIEHAQPFGGSVRTSAWSTSRRTSIRASVLRRNDVGR
jgi:hypothetical protein